MSIESTLPLLLSDKGFGFAFVLTAVVSGFVMDFNILLDIMSFEVKLPST